MDFGSRLKSTLRKLVPLSATLVFLLMLGLPKFAHAIPTEVTADVPATAKTFDEKIKETTRMTLVGSIFTYIVNMMQFASDRLAYDAAVMVASGGPAESPLYDGTPVEQYFKEYGAAVAGESIGLLQDDLEASGGTLGAIFTNFNLCQPDADVTIALSLGIQAAFERPTPKCDFKSIKNNWKGFVADIQDEGTADNQNQLILAQLADAFDPQTNEFSVGIELQSSILNKSLQDSIFRANVKIKEGGFQPVTNFITGNEATPASLINAYTVDQTFKGEKVNQQIGVALLGNSDALLQVGIHAGSVFTNTLLSELTKKLGEGLFNQDPNNVDPFGDIENIATSNAESARNQYRSLLAFTPLEVTNYSILSEFSSCPSGTSRGLYNCVANSSFISAIGRADAGAPVTIEEALEQHLLDGNWPLIPSSDLARNQDPFCYTYGFCYSNLVKLRKARIISIGWELAAESIYNSSASNVTLQEVVDGFTDCNTAGEADINHPWCKLIDPNWVLKYPETQCKALVNGQLLIASSSSERQQECVDMPSCIAENDDGTCTGGYGYCVAEENTWRFRGETCPAQFASCLTFEGEDKTVSYLQNTVDYAGCSADNAGCLWYSTEKSDPEGDGTYDWQPVDNVAAADAAPDAYTSRIYFNGSVEDCTGENGGCSQLFERDDSVRLNVLQNPSFEDDVNNDGIADGWQRSDSSVVVDRSGQARTGDGTITLGPTNSISAPGVAVSQGRFYTLSFYARQKIAGNNGLAQASLAFLAIDPGNDIDLNGTSFVPATGTTCAIEDSGNLTNGNGLDDALGVDGRPAGTDYERYSCTFTSPVVDDAASLIVATLSIEGNVYVDDVQLEQGEDASEAHIGYSTVDLTSLTVKVPPAYLGCQGNASDPAECANYAQVCSENDVGCTAYTPTNGDPTVTGVASELDACPSMCVGYDTFMQEPTLYEPAGDFPVYFIPDTAEVCSDADVGCDEFTNLSDESLEYYTYLRSCVTPTEAAANTNGDNEATFYTWEGSDLAGYQLKTWELLESNMSTSPYTYVSGGVDSTPHLAPCSIWTATADGIVCSDEIDSDGDFKKDWDTATCDDHDDIFTNPDCREFYDTNGGIHYRQWSKTVTVDDACIAYRKTDLAGVDIAAQTANCQTSGGFYDAPTGTCRYNGLGSESNSCSAAANGCREYTGGRSRNSRLILEDTLESGSLSNWDAASAADVTLSNESLATSGHSIAATNQFSTFIFNNGAACNDPEGCEGNGVSLGGNCTVIEGNQYCGTIEGNLFQGKTYTLTFWAKGSGTLTTGFDTGAQPGLAATDVAFGTVDLTSGWQQFSLGPLNMTGEDYPAFGPDTTLVFDPSDLAYIDNITLREGEDNITVIKNSWVTPAECDQSPTGAASPQYYLGCQEYTTQDSQTAYLKSFSKLCSEDKIGCEDFFMTHESASPYAEVFQATCANPSGAPVTSPTSCYYQNDGAGGFDTTSQYLCTIGVGLTSCTFDMSWYESPDNLPSHISYGASTVVVSADSDAFLVVNDDVTCSAAYAGCTEVGKPEWSQDKDSTTGATSVFLMNDPDTYADTLCNEGELFCAAWNTDNDGTFYFKDPADQTCDYRTNVLINGADYDGWFRTGTDEFCYGTCDDGITACSSDAQCGGAPDSCDTQDPSYVINGTLSGVWRNGDDNYLGWVGQCGSENSTCSEFQDPLDINTDEQYQLADGKQYFYLNNDNLDENVLPDSQRCNGQVSLKEGCALFNDTSEPSQGFNASASEMLSTHADVLVGRAPFALVDPVDCEAGDSTQTLADGTVIDLCAQRCIYDQGAVHDITDGVIRGTKLQEEINEGNANKYDFDDLYLTGTSCYDISDCGTMQAESGTEVQALDCNTDARVTRSAVTGTEERTDVPRLENDTNTILKVNRDRQCSEWLSCAEDQASWDERTNSWKTVCTDVELCDKYSSVGGTTFCSEWKSNEPEVVLDNDVYTARDISWYGQELSGYAIPDLFPVQTLEQANVSPPPGFCDLTEALADGDVTQTDFEAKHGNACDSETDCGGSAVTNYCVDDDQEDFRLALVAGSCTGDFGDSCTVGFCEDTGAACSTTSDCGTDGGSCIVGSCQLETVNSSGGDLCASDSDCSEGDICSGTTCVTPGANVTIENYDATDPAASCSGGEVFAAHTSLQTGSCIREQCLLTPDGKTFDTATTEGKLCRAQPEVNSPFGNDLVERWADPDNGGVARDAGAGYSVEFDGTHTDDVPYDVRTGFENVNLCAPGEACECSYRKITYGEGSEIRYWSPDTEVDSNEGICTAGQVNLACTDNVDCDTATGNDGVCSKITREDVLLGLEGYCLEKDTGININGDRDQGACLTWLPVDQLAGSTDLYAKFTEAGFYNDTFACSYVSPFVNLTMSDHPEPGTEGQEGDIACAEFPHGPLGVEKGDVNVESDLDVCANNVVCPSGYWAMMSMPHSDINGLGTMADACTSSTADGNDCAYVCIPLGATTVDTEGVIEEDSIQSCDPDSEFVTELLSSTADEAFDEASSDSNYNGTPASVTQGWSFDDRADDVKILSAQVDGDDGIDTPLYARFDDMVAALEHCSLKAVEFNQDIESAIYNRATHNGELNWIGDGLNNIVDDDDLTDDVPVVDDEYSWSNDYTYRNLHLNGEFYAACEEVVRVVDGSANKGYPWTDKLLGPNSLTTEISSPVQGLNGLMIDVLPGPYGLTTEEPVTTDPVDGQNNWPDVVATCQDLDFDFLQQPHGVPPQGCDTDEENYLTGGSVADDPSLDLKDRLNPGEPMARSLVDFTYTRSLSEFNNWSAADAVANAFDFINQLFAGVDIGVDDNEYIWNDVDSDDDNNDVSWPNIDRKYQKSTFDDNQDVRAEEGTPPKVWSLLSGSCVGTECEEGDENSLTLNDQSTGDHFGADFFRAYLKFYAAADKNQLPIRRVIIDWGDGVDQRSDGFQGASDDGNFYKNHRGLDGFSDKSFCDLNNEWGETPESCDPNYFSYSHVYTCEPEVINDDSRACQYNAKGIVTNSPCWVDNGINGAADRVCVFQPAVHIRDNWGWCTGECTYDGEPGCYEGDNVDSLNNPTSSTSECGYKYERYPTDDSTIDPWVYYDGTVTVDPQ